MMSSTTPATLTFLGHCASRARFFSVVSIAGLGALLSVGCEKETPVPSDEPVLSVSGQPTTAASQVSPDVGAYCRRMCQRASACGTANAQDLANDIPGLQRSMQKEREKQSEVEQRCVQECQADAPSSAAQRAALERAEKCLEQDSCESFSDCLRAVAVVEPAAEP